ncbi:MAG: peroxiredoxin [Sutterella wadsworthensis]|nr:peroxiredoxin [Sutterella wadsworthensis]
MTERIQLEAGQPAPAFTLPGYDDQPVTLDDFKGRGLILYFYPKDNTAGCTTEALGFRDHLADFEALGYTVVGVSRDSVKSHCGFRDRQGLNFLLLADKEEVACTAYGVMKEKMMYGKKCRGIERSTFVIDANGVLKAALYGVKAKTHVEELLASLNA